MEKSLELRKQWYWNNYKYQLQQNVNYLLKEIFPEYTPKEPTVGLDVISEGSEFSEGDEGFNKEKKTS